MARRKNPEAPAKSLTVKRGAAKFMAEWIDAIAYAGG